MKKNYVIIAVIIISLIFIGVGISFLPKNITNRYRVKNQNSIFNGKSTNINIDTGANTTYDKFALSDTDYSFDSSNPENIKNRNAGIGLVPKILDHGQGYLKVYADSAQTELNIPFGWYGLDTGQKTLFYTPDKTITLSVRYADAGGLDFLGVKKQVQAEYQEYKNNGAQIEHNVLPDGSFLSKALGVTSSDGQKLSMVSVYTSNPKGGHYFMKLLMSAPESIFDKYYGLVGLILKDRKIIWAY